MDGTPERELGRYRIIRQVGEGAMAVVHLAHQVELDRFVALKELNRLHAADPEWAARFLRESRLAGSLTHPNVVTVFDYFEAHGTPYIAMEYMERGSLRPHVGRLTFAQSAQVLHDVLAGLGQAERRAIVHRDLKPENLLVTEAGTVKIADFGIAKVTSELSTQAFRTAAGITVGTPAYMAPEQALARDDIGPWTDLYAVGCIAYELFTGAPPFSSVNDHMALMLRHVNDEIPPARSMNSNVPPDVSDWIDALLVKEPSERTRSARAAWLSFEEILLAQLGPRWHHAAELPAAPAGKPASSARRHAGAVDSAALTAGLSAGTGEPPPSAWVTFSAPPLRTATPPPAWDAPATTAPGAARSPAPGDIAVDPHARTVPPRPRSTPPSPAPERPRGAKLPALVAAALLVLLVGIVLLARGDDPAATESAGATTPVPTPATLTAGTLSVRLPAGWTRREGAELPGYDLARAASAGPPGDAPGSVVLGLAPAIDTTPALLPVDVTPTVPKTVDLDGGLAAYRYAGVDPGAIVHVVPTDAGVATVACQGAEAATCDGIAGTLTIGDATAFPPGPSDAYASTLASVTTAINRARLLSVAAMRKARTPRAQAQAIRRLEGQIDARVKALRALALSPADQGSNRDLAAALSALADGYGDLHDAGRRERRAAYETARGDVRSAQHRAQAVLTRLVAAGYAGLPELDAPATPALRRKPKPEPVPEPVAPVATQPPTTPTYTPRPTYTPPRPKPKYGDPVTAPPEGE